MNTVDANLWPDEKLSAAEVRSWIASNLPDNAIVSGPLRIYRQNNWALTAVFETHPATGLGSDLSAGDIWALDREMSRHEQVVFKASFLPTDFAVVKAYDLVARSCPNNVPTLVAWIEEGGQRWMLFREFTGDLIASTQENAVLIDVARTMAKIQLAVSRVPVSTLLLPGIGIQDISWIYDEIVEDIRSKYLNIWSAYQGALMKKYGLSAATFQTLMAWRESIGKYVSFLAASQLPLSIVHADLDETNAVKQENGEILIFDWDASVIGCAFLTLDKLLGDARSRDLKAGHYQVGNTPMTSMSSWTPTERALRNAYLEEFVWSTRSERELAFDMVMRLAPLFTAHAFKRFAEAVGLDQSIIAEYTAWCLARAEYRWQ